MHSRRTLLKAAGAMAGSFLLPSGAVFGQTAASDLQTADPTMGGPADYTLTIGVKPIELAPNPYRLRHHVQRPIPRPAAATSKKASA